MPHLIRRLSDENVSFRRYKTFRLELEQRLCKQFPERVLPRSGLDGNRGLSYSVKTVQLRDLIVQGEQRVLEQLREIASPSLKEDVGRVIKLPVRFFSVRRFPAVMRHAAYPSRCASAAAFDAFDAPARMPVVFLPPRVPPVLPLPASAVTSASASTAST